MFQYVSIISVSTIPSQILFPRFTFQYVFIISLYSRDDICVFAEFTFQYVSIISNQADSDVLSIQYLHSNMFLLFLFMIYFTHEHI